MAGINVPQYEIFKIGTKQLKYQKWDLKIEKKLAKQCNEMVALFEAEEFRTIAHILDKPINEIDFSEYLAMIVIDNPRHFNRAVDQKGIKINGVTFRRFVGTTGGLKNHSLLFVRSELLDVLNEYCDCGRKEIEIVPAKFEAYKALYCSASQPICSPNGIVVVPDCVITGLKADVVLIDDSGSSEEPSVSLQKDYPIENTPSDGFSLCTPEYMHRVSEFLGLDYDTSGVCIRAPWLKGMLYPFPIYEFIEECNGGNYMIIDSWGQKKDLRNCEMIVTESCLKLWKSYESAEQYLQCCEKYHHGFSITKISPHQLDDIRELNYQYLQSYDFTDEDIAELCAPTVEYLKQSCCGDYETTKEFLGIKGGAEKGTWQRALYTSEYMMGDPYIIDATHRMIRNKIDQSKIGKLRVHGNYQIVSGDPFALMQNICGLQVTGLLKAGEIYSKYWADQNVEEVVMFRSPMLAHNNIKKQCVVNNDDVNKWYRYMQTIVIVNGFDTTCQALSGMDCDGDLSFTTNNAVLLRRHQEMPAIVCIQRNAVKVIPTEQEIQKTNINGMGNKVGTITNRVTAMFDRQQDFEINSQEWLEIQKRILCGQLFQQDEIDKIKGIIAKPMPPYWYDVTVAKNKDENTEDNYFERTCTFKKPYFMIYVYKDYKQKYNAYQKKCDLLCMNKFGATYEDLRYRTDLDDDQAGIVLRCNEYQPYSTSPSAMNRICWYLEKQFANVQIELKHTSDFDYRIFLYDIPDDDVIKNELKLQMNDYIAAVKKYKDSNAGDYMESVERIVKREQLKDLYKTSCKIICPDDHLRLNLILDLCYGHNGNKQFCWDCIGDLIINRLEELQL